MWGEDVEVYGPERWFERDQNAMQKTFNPFSVGPSAIFLTGHARRADYLRRRVCVGRNPATMELQIIIASLLRRYSFVLERLDHEDIFPNWLFLA